MPVVLSLVLSVVYNMVDTWFISMTGDTNLVAGVSVCAPVFVLSVAMGDIWGLGGSSLMARLLGKREDETAGGVSAFCLYTAFGTGLVFMAVMLILRNPILRLLGANDASWSHASAYFSWIALGTPFIILSMIPNNQLRTEGLSTSGMWGAAAGSITNIALDPLFIFALNMGAAGAALATTLSNILSCAVFMLLTNRALESFGNENIAAMGIAMKINMICTMTLIGFAFGAQPLFGYNYGSRNVIRFRKTLRFAYLFELCLGAGFAVILFLASPFLMKVFIDDGRVISSGIIMLRFMQISSLLMGVSLVTICVCQAVGNAAGALALSVSRQGVLFFVTITVLTTWIGFKGILLAQPLSDLLTGILAIIIISGILRKMDPPNIA